MMLLICHCVFIEEGDGRVKSHDVISTLCIKARSMIATTAIYSSEKELEMTLKRAESEGIMRAHCDIVVV